MKPRVLNQGKVVVEQHDGEFYVMLPDGSIEIWLTRSEVETCAKRWFRKHASDDAFNVGTIEWR